MALQPDPAVDWLPWKIGLTWDYRFTRAQPGKTFHCEVEVRNHEGRVWSRRGAGKSTGRRKLVWITWQGRRIEVQTLKVLT